MDQSQIANHIVESLRRGIPPQRGVELYSVGNEELIEGIKKRHLEFPAKSRRHFPHERHIIAPVHGYITTVPGMFG